MRSQSRFQTFFKFLWPVVTGMYLLLGIVAPILSAKGSNSGWIYYLLGRTCHQMPERSWFIAGHQLGFCARCTGLHVGLFLAGLTLALLPGILSRIQRPVIVAAILVVPMLIDVLLGPFLPAFNLRSISTITGFLAASGLTIAIFSAILCEK